MNDNGKGWTTFAGVILVVAGIMRLFDAIWAFRYHGTLPANLEGAIFGTSLSTYGWLFLVVAIVLFLCGWGVFVGSQAARLIGILAAVIACISAAWWLPFYPLWSLTYVILGALVIYALVAHGGEPSRAR